MSGIYSELTNLEMDRNEGLAVLLHERVRDYCDLLLASGRALNRRAESGTNPFIRILSRLLAGT